MAKRRKSYSKKRRSYGSKSRASRPGRQQTVKVVLQMAPAQGGAISPMAIPGTTLVSGPKPGRAKF